MRNEAIVLGFSTPQKEAIWDWGISGQDTRLFATKLPFARSESRRTPVSALGSDCWVRYGSIDRLMCAHFSVGLTLLLHHLWNRATPFSPGVTACLKQDDFAETCGQKSIFPLLAKSSTGGGATQLSQRLGHSDWPVKGPITSVKMGVRTTIKVRIATT